MNSPISIRSPAAELPAAPAPAQPRRPGRPRKLDDAKRREICALISVGCAIGDAAKYVGCATSTIHREANRNPQFDELLRRSQLAAQLQPLQAIRAAAAKHWRAGAWLLERLNPERFAKRNPLFITPQQLEAFLKLAVEMADEELNDPKMVERLLRGYEKLARYAHQECRANDDPYERYERKRQARNRNRAAPAWSRLSSPVHPSSPPHAPDPDL